MSAVCKVRCDVCSPGCTAEKEVVLTRMQFFEPRVARWAGIVWEAEKVEMEEQKDNEDGDHHDRRADVGYDGDDAVDDDADGDGGEGGGGRLPPRPSMLS